MRRKKESVSSFETEGFAIYKKIVLSAKDHTVIDLDDDIGTYRHGRAERVRKEIIKYLDTLEPQ